MMTNDVAISAVALAKADELQALEAP